MPIEFMLFCTVLVIIMVIGTLVAWGIQLWDWAWARWMVPFLRPWRQ